MVKKASFISVLLFITVVFLNPVYGQEKQGDKKTDEVKVSGTIVQTESDPSGKLAPVAIKTDKEQYPLIQNALANKMAKYAGSKAKVTGRFVDVGNKKVLEPWLYERQDPSGKKPKFKQPVEG
jgi:hypothetical protein